MNKVPLNPLIIILLLVTVLIFGTLFLLVIDRSKASNRIEKIFIILCFINILGCTVVPLSMLNPASLAMMPTKLVSPTVFAQLIFYALGIFLLRSKFVYFYPSIGYLLRNPFLSGLLLIALLSALWSETPIVTFRSSLILLIYAVFASYIAARNNFQAIGNLLRTVGTFNTIAGALAAILVPSIGRMQDAAAELAGTWKGILDHKNGFAFWMALTSALWFLNAIHYPKSRRTSIGLGTLSLLVMVPASSGASKLMFLAMMVVLLLSQSAQKLRRTNIRKAVVFTMFPLIFLGVIVVTLLANKAAVLAVMGKDATLTGRTEFWPQIMQAVWRKPLLGYGYDGFWQSWRGYENPARTIINSSQFVPPHAHNGYLEILISTGFIGLTLFALALLLNLFRLILFVPVSRKGEAETVIIMLIFLLLSSISESKLWVTNDHTFMFFILSTRLGIDVFGPSAKSTEPEALHPQC